jgi:hypothetical protein
MGMIGNHVFYTPFLTRLLEICQKTILDLRFRTSKKPSEVRKLRKAKIGSGGRI